MVRPSFLLKPMGVSSLIASEPEKLRRDLGSLRRNKVIYAGLIRKLSVPLAKLPVS